MARRHQYTDTDPFPFGTHRDRDFAAVPTRYLEWLYDNEKDGGLVEMDEPDENAPDAQHQRWGVKCYIEEAGIA